MVRTSTFEREEYERIPSEESSQTLAHNFLRLLRRLFWLAVGITTILYTNLHTHILNWRQELDPFGCYFLAACVAVVLGTMAYLVFYVKRVHGRMALRRWRTFAPGAVQTMTGANLLAFVAAVRLFYPIYGRWTILIVLLLSWSWLSVLSFL